MGASKKHNLNFKNANFKLATYLISYLDALFSVSGKCELPCCEMIAKA